jgi:hypothetical protein
MKWLIGLAAVLLVAAFAYHQRNTVKIAYVNGLPAYNHLPGRIYILQRDCYIFSFKDRNGEWPFLAAHATVPALPAAVEEKAVAADQPDVRLLDVVRAGTRFKLVSVRRDESRQGTSITFEILFLEEDRKYLRVDAFYMLDHTPEKDGAAPVFLEDYAAERVMK